MEIVQEYKNKAQELYTNKTSRTRSIYGRFAINILSCRSICNFFHS